MSQPLNNGETLEGEGSYTATRGYDSRLRQNAREQNAREQNVGKLADEARRALEGPEGAELEGAEEVARRGAHMPSTKKP